MTRVTQIAVLEEYSLMLILSNQSLIAQHLDAVCSQSFSDLIPKNTSDPSSRREPQRISGVEAVPFFTNGRMGNRQLVFYKHRSTDSSTFKVLEPIDREISQFSLRQLVPRKEPMTYFRKFDEFHIPGNAHGISLFQSTVAIATTKGIEVLALDKKIPISIPDLKAPECAYIAQRLRGQLPLGMFRLSDSEFLIVFEEVGVYVNKHGDISRAVVMEFVGRAKQACLYQNTYLILIDSGNTFVEIRNADNGRLRQIINGRGVKMLDDASQGGTVKICMQHPEEGPYMLVLELILNEGQKE